MSKSRGPKEPDATQRLADCERYHMPFDGVARTFYDGLAEMAQVGKVASYEQLFQDIHEAQRLNFLREMSRELPAKERLELIVRLTGNLGLTKFLEDMVANRSAYDEGVLQVNAEAEAFGYFHTATVPKNARLSIYLSTIERVDECEDDEAISQLPYERLLVVRALGNDWFKVLDENYSDDLWCPNKEKFDVQDKIRFGTPLREKDGRCTIEPICRFQEAIAVSRGGKKVTILGVVDRDEDPEEAEPTDVIVTSVELDDQQVLPASLLNA